MKISLYLEFYHFWNGRLFKDIGTGLLSSYRNQKTMLEKADIEYTEKYESDSDIVEINTPWLKSLYIIRKARKNKQKIIIWAHVTAEDAEQVFRFTPMVMPLFRRYLAFAYDQADIVFCPTAYTKRLIAAYGISEEKLVVQSNAVDTEKYFPDEKARQAGRREHHIEELAVGTVGLVIPRKGIDTFLSLAKSFPQNKFIWYGKIYSSIMVKPLPATLPSNCVFTGFVRDILTALNSLDVFIFPSYEENQGMAILEAAAVGLPILVRDLPAYEGWLIDGENCLKAKTDEDFLRLLRRLLDDQDLRQRLNQGAIALAQSESKEYVAEERIKIYKNLLEINNE